MNCSMANKVRHFVNTAKNVVEHVVKTGRVKTEDNQLKIRRQICSSCEYLYDSRCQKCGCFISTKTSLEAANCPINRW